MDERIIKREEEIKTLCEALKIFEKRKYFMFSGSIVRKEFYQLICDIENEILMIKNPKYRKAYKEMGGKVEIEEV